MESLPDLAFSVDPELCNRCGRCVADCPAKILTIPSEGPVQMILEDSDKCYRCQHCLAVCSHAAISILGRNPQESFLLAGNDYSKLAVFRDRLLAGIEKASETGSLPTGRESFATYPKAWKEDQIDVLFRGAPHFVVTSAPRNVATPQVDCIIALSYFELLANARGVATVWDGLAYWTLTELVPEASEWLGIPNDHVIGYCMAFGLPKFPFQRTVQHTPPEIHWIK